MTIEEAVVEKLIGNFNVLDGKCIIQRQRRITVEVPRDIFMNVIQYGKLKLNFTMLCTITGLDMGENLQVIYHLANDTGVVLNLKLNVPKSNPSISTVTPIFEGVILYEKELIDMFGIEVKGIPPGSRYPLPDFWPEGQYPMRKDWKQESLDILKGGKENE